ncbi:hypothetical protein WJX73_007302 [Symbiochloris irregularis]|uniref:Uncharacterized protein n=1 Tax=Symbiochloris irregularis TaxID=706552 RepID=A0AAW1NQ50_9CHLO
MPGSDESGDYVSRVLTGTGVGYGLGAVLGAVTANWSDVPKILRDKPWPALKATGAVMGRFGLTFAVVGAAFTAVDCTLEAVRGQQDMWNGIIGGGKLVGDGLIDDGATPPRTIYPYEHYRQRP